MKVNKVEVVNAENYDCYCRWLGNQVTQGNSLAAYDCPHCNSPLYVTAPPPGDSSDSLTTCPVCNGNFFRFTENSGGLMTFTSFPPWLPA